MIELLLQAERSLAVGLVDQAERLYRQAADADPRNSIAVVGLARVALERGDEPEAWRLAKRALEIDPENVAGQRLAERLEEVWAFRGESLPEAAGPTAPSQGSTTPPAARSVDVPPDPTTQGPVAAPPDPRPDPVSTPAADAGAPDPKPHRGVIDRLLRRNRP